MLSSLCRAFASLCCVVVLPIILLVSFRSSSVVEYLQQCRDMPTRRAQPPRLLHGFFFFEPESPVKGAAPAREQRTQAPSRLQSCSTQLENTREDAAKPAPCYALFRSGLKNCHMAKEEARLRGSYEEARAAAAEASDLHERRRGKGDARSKQRGKSGLLPWGCRVHPDADSAGCCLSSTPASPSRFACCPQLPPITTTVVVILLNIATWYSTLRQ